MSVATAPPTRRSAAEQARLERIERSRPVFVFVPPRAPRVSPCEQCGSDVLENIHGGNVARFSSRAVAEVRTTNAILAAIDNAGCIHAQNLERARIDGERFADIDSRATRRDGQRLCAVRNGPLIEW